MSKKLQTEIKVDKVSITFLNRIQLRHVYLQDMNGDTLLYADKVKARISRFNRSGQEISIGRLALDNAYIHLITDSTGVINLKFIIDKMKNPEKEKKGGNWKTSFDRIELVNSHFRYTRFGEQPVSDSGINFQDMNLRDLQIKLADLNIQGDTISYDIKKLSFLERSGFRLDNMNAHMSLSKSHMYFGNVFLETPLSNLSANQVRFNFDSYDDFSDFVNKVKTRFNFRSSTVNFIDIGYFAPIFTGYDETVKISGLVTGYIADMTGQNILLSYNNHTSLDGSFNMIGLPDFRQTFMHFNIRQLTTNINDIQSLKLPGNKHLRFPDHFGQLGTISYTGKFTGYIDDFVAYGKFNSNLGQLSSDLLIKPDSLSGLTFKGRLKSRSFNIGKLTSNDQLIGNISMALNVDGYTSRDSLSANIDGNIDSLGFYNYTYKRIKLSGLLSNKKFDGTVNINDPNLKMEFLGKVDFETSKPKFDFTANVSSIKPYYLNIDKSDPDYFASFLLKTNFTGKNIDDIDGEIKLVNSFFQKSDKQIQVYDLTLISSNSADSNRISVQSDILDGQLSGHYQFSTLGRSFKNLAYHYLPTLAQDNLWVPDSTDNNNFNFNLNLKKISSVVNFFLPNYEIADSSYFAGKYNPAGLEIDLIGDCPMFGFYGNQWNDLQIITSSDFNKTELLTRSRSLILKNNLALDNLTLNASVFNDTVTLDLDWNSFQKPKYEGKLSLLTDLSENKLTRNPKFNIHMQPSTVIFNDTTWNISRSTVVIDSSSVKVDSFSISNQNQLFLVSGGISSNPEETLKFEFNDLDLATLNIFTKKVKLEFNGQMTGSASLKDPLNNPLFLADLDLEEFFVNGQDFGNGEIKALWNNEDKRIHMLADAKKGSAEILRTEGNFYPESRKMDFDITFDKIRLNTFSPYTDFLISDLKGLGSGNLKLTGTTSQPDLNGKISLFKTSFIVNYLQTRYYFTNDVEISHNNVLIKDFEVYDQQGDKTLAQGSVSTRYFKDINLDIRLQTDNFNFLNTTEKDNQMFYGKIFASGFIKITGPPDNLEMDINARSEKNSVFFIPLYGSEEVNENDFIKFVNTNGSENQEKEKEQNRYEVNLRGLSLNFNLDVTNDAEVQLIFDPKVGDILKGRGNGNLKININTLGKFEIFGDITIQSGDYLFTLQNVINKKFEVEPGGRISWNGDPEDANIDVKAVYALRTPVSPLDPTLFEGSTSKRIPVECVIQMTGKLMNPTIKPDIVLPTADQETRRIVKNSTSTEEELMKQFLSLLVVNSFYSNQQSYGGFAGTGAATTAFASAGVATSELLSNQLNHWLSQISKDFDIGFNYRPGSEISSDEYEVALSTQILNDRITINGNVDFGGNQTTQTTTTTNTNNIVGDFDIDVKITENGKVHMKAFNRANDNLLFQTSPYTQGVGVFFREDFNTFGGLLRRYKDAIIELFTSDKKKKQEKELNKSIESKNEITP